MLDLVNTDETGEYFVTLDLIKRTVILNNMSVLYLTLVRLFRVFNVDTVDKDI